MDNLPSHILSNIYSFLPWNGRIAARRLSSKFLKQPQWKDYLPQFVLREQPECFIFALKRRTIVIVKMSPQTTDRNPTVSQTNSEEAGIMYKKTTIGCPEFEQYYRFIDTYMEMFFTHFYCNTLDLIDLSPDSLSKIDCRRLKENVVQVMLMKPFWLRFYQSHSILSAEAKKLLKMSKKLYSLDFRAPLDFQIPADFLDLLPLDIMLNFQTCRFESFEYKNLDNIANTDMGINDDFLRERIKKKQRIFKALTVFTDISTNFIKEYVEDVFRGGYTMLELSVAHKVGWDDVCQLWGWLRASGFELLTPNQFDLTKIVNGRQTRKGYDPDRIIVRIGPEFFQVIGDYACYRAKKSIGFKFIN